MAVILLIASDLSMWMTLAFPSWVLVVSLLALNKAGLIDLRRDPPNDVAESNSR